MAARVDDPRVSVGGVHVGTLGISVPVDCPGDAAGLEPVTIGSLDLRAPGGLV
jgi:hypothetical protein